MIKPNLRCAVLAASLVALAGPQVMAQDLEGSSDHPMISRYPEAVIDQFQEDAFDEVDILTGPVKGQEPDAVETVEGRVTRIRYWVPKTRSPLEVFRNYEEGLAGGGFETLFTCKDKACGGRAFNHAAVPYTVEQGDAYNDQRYLAARLARAEGDVSVALYISRAYGIGGDKKDRIYVQLTVVEAKPMERGLVSVDAAAMREGLDAEGHIALYGILFAFDSAEVQPDSKAALDEINKLLQGDPGLKLLVVGHTDGKGSQDYNRDLSERRARAVVAKLVADYGIAAERLEGHGVGLLAPVASNDTEEGRALNRRVELVRRLE